VEEALDALEIRGGHGWVHPSNTRARRANSLTAMLGRPKSPVKRDVAAGQGRADRAGPYHAGVETIGVRQARRLALACAGLLKPEWTGLPRRAAGGGARARAAAAAVIERFGYLQLDTVSIAGARSQAIVLLSRLEGLDPALAEALLRPGAPFFEYWGHEASYLPLDLYPAFEFRRRDFRQHPWWGNVVGRHPEVARNLLRRIRDEGPLRSLDMEGRGSRGWWDLKEARRVAAALWSSGELAIRERRNFQRSFDLAERVIPEPLRSLPLPLEAALEVLVLRALRGHGWATTTTIVATWRLASQRRAVIAALHRLAAAGQVAPCALVTPEGRVAGWVRPDDLALAARLERVRPRPERGVLLSPFDPILWDRGRVARLFDFEQVLEIFKPAPQRVYGYYCLPVLAGERLVARVDLKAERARGALRVLRLRHESTGTARAGTAAERDAVASALSRYADGVSLKLRR
jgi:hypothetical protein